jgi:hypothetical protein
MTLKQSQNRQFKRSNKNQIASVITFALIAASMIAINGSQNAYAANKCIGQTNNHCYAQHNFSQKFTGAYNGMQSTEKVLSTTIASGSWIQNSNWAIHPDGVHFVEFGWHQNNNASPYFMCGIDGGTRQFGSAPSDNTYYVFKGEDLNLDSIWHIDISGNTCNLASASTSAFMLQVGYELTNSDAQTLRKNDYTGLQFARAPNTWAFWNSADGGNGWTLKPNDGTYFVKLCGGTAEQYWHSQHGQGTAPATCS